MPRVPPGQSLNLLKGRGVSRNRKQKPVRLTSIRACRERAVAVAQAAEVGLISAGHATALIKLYQAIVGFMLDEHELKQRGIRDETPDDNAPELDAELSLGTHIKRKAVVKRGTGRDGTHLDERTIALEASGPDPDALTLAEAEHDALDEAELAEAMQPLEDEA